MIDNDIFTKQNYSDSLKNKIRGLYHLNNGFIVQIYIIIRQYKIIKLI